MLDDGESGKSAFITCSIVMLSVVKGEGMSGVQVSVIDVEISFVLDEREGGSQGKVRSLHVL